MQIEISNYTKKIKKNILLDNINIKMESGKIYGMCGRNGSGKTMLMRAISGLINPNEGYVKIDEKIIGKDISFPESIGLLLEYPGFVRKYSGFKNLKMIASLKGIAGDNQIKNTMIKTGLNPENKKSFGSYSLGMKQKLGIANAIMGEPDLIILDEPINALDGQTVMSIKTELLKLRDEGKLIVIACHDREELEFLCDIIYEIKNGTVAGCEVIGE